MTNLSPPTAQDEADYLAICEDLNARGLLSDERLAELRAEAANALAPHVGHGCPQDPTWDPDTRSFKTPEVMELEDVLAVALRHERRPR